VIHRHLVRKVWLHLESSLLPRLREMITVSDSIAEIFRERYGIPVSVVRNIPPNRGFKKTHTREDLKLPADRKIIILQGSGINIQRGAEELIQAMRYLDGYHLLLIGGGDVMGKLKQMAQDLSLGDRILFRGRMPVEELFQYTCNADLGISIDKDTNPNYRYSLPNKLFDYIHAGIPVLASPLVEVKRIVEEYEIGTMIRDHNPEHIAECIKSTFSNEKQLAKWKENLKFAASALNWEKEKSKLEAIFEKYA
jgi:glycosyltransferase involved in cell wall biosynthesis